MCITSVAIGGIMFLGPAGSIIAQVWSGANAPHCSCDSKCSRGR